LLYLKRWDAISVTSIAWFASTSLPCILPLLRLQCLTTLAAPRRSDVKSLALPVPWLCYDPVLAESSMQRLCQPTYNTQSLTHNTQSLTHNTHNHGLYAWCG
jgi:hypothetical protein